MPSMLAPSSSSIGRIPEVVEGILAYLSGPDLTQTMRVSRQWRRLSAPLLYAHLPFHLPMTAERMASLLGSLGSPENARHARSLRYHEGFSPVRTEKEAVEAYSDEGDVDTDIDVEEMPPVPMMLKCVKREMVSEMPSDLPTLRGLQMLSIEGEEVGGVERMLGWVKARAEGMRIERLKIRSVEMPERELMRGVLRRLGEGGLRELEVEVTGSGEMDVEGILPMEAFRKLQSLTLTLPMGGVDGDALATGVRQWMGGLERLRVNTLGPLTVEAYASLMAHRGWKRLHLLTQTSYVTMPPLEEDYGRLLEGSSELEELIVLAGTHCAATTLARLMEGRRMERLEVGGVGRGVRGHGDLGKHVGADGTFRYCGVREIMRRYGLPASSRASVEEAVGRGHVFALCHIDMD